MTRPKNRPADPIAQAAAELAAARHRVEVAQGELEAAAARLGEARGDRAAAARELDDLADALAASPAEEVRARYAALVARREELDGIVRALERRCDFCRAEVARLEAAVLEAEAADLAARTTKAERELLAAAASLDALLERVAGEVREAVDGVARAGEGLAQLRGPTGGLYPDGSSIGRVPAAYDAAAVVRHAALAVRALLDGAPPRPLRAMLELALPHWHHTDLQSLLTEVRPPIAAPEAVPAPAASVDPAKLPNPLPPGVMFDPITGLHFAQAPAPRPGTKFAETAPLG